MMENDIYHNWVCAVRVVCEYGVLSEEAIIELPFAILAALRDKV